MNGGQKILEILILFNLKFLKTIQKPQFSSKIIQINQLKINFPVFKINSKSVKIVQIPQHPSRYSELIFKEFHLENRFSRDYAKN